MNPTLDSSLFDKASFGRAQSLRCFMHSRPVTVKDIVLVGGGHSHVNVLRMFGMKPEPNIRLTMISKDVLSVYSGMLPGHIEGIYTHEECHIDLRPLCRFANARLVIDACSGVDLTQKVVRLHSGRPAIKYDLLAIDVGITPGACPPLATPVKPVSGFSDRWRQVLQRIQESTVPMRVAVVGGGAGGVELVLAMRSAVDRLRAQRGDQLAPMSFTLVTRGELLASHSARARRAVRNACAARGVSIVEQAAVLAVTPGELLLEDGRALPAEEVVWCTDAAAQPWMAQSGLDAEGGFLRVRPTLESTSHAGVFASGDCAAVDGFPRPKAGVYAVRQGPPLAANLRRAALGAPLLGFTPQSSHLGLLSVGGGMAVASKGSFGAGGISPLGALLWRWKDHIDRKFMRMYCVLPEMASPQEQASRAVAAAGPEALAAASAAAMRCGGCGAKVGSSSLSRVLARLDVPQRPEVVLGVGDDAAVVEVPPGMVSVQTVDYFRAFIDDPYLLGRIAAVHALGDCWAMGAAPHAALAIVQVPFGLESKVEEELYQMMAGACSALREAGCALAGGHSSEGAELACGFSVHGVVAPAAILRKGGLLAGQSIVLTKPLGTGVIFAADMRGKAAGSCVEAALASMATQSGTAARVLQEHGATAATDVTGFGLLGHLVEMLRASRARASLSLGALPALPGAAQLFQEGFASSLAPDNRRAARALSPGVGEAERAHALFPLLFDPQTAGGLLAGVPGDRAAACVDALRKAGYEYACVIGTVLEGMGGDDFDVVGSVGLELVDGALGCVDRTNKKML